MVSMCGFSEDLKMACKVGKVFSFCLFVSWWNNMLTDTGRTTLPFFVDQTGSLQNYLDKQAQIYMDSTLRP